MPLDLRVAIDKAREVRMGNDLGRVTKNSVVNL